MSGEGLIEYFVAPLLVSMHADVANVAFGQTVYYTFVVTDPNKLFQYGSVRLRLPKAARSYSATLPYFSFDVNECTREGITYTCVVDVAVGPGQKLMYEGFYNDDEAVPTSMVRARAGAAARRIQARAALTRRWVRRIPTSTPNR